MAINRSGLWTTSCGLFLYWISVLLALLCDSLTNDQTSATFTVDVKLSPQDGDNCVKKFEKVLLFHNQNN